MFSPSPRATLLLLLGLATVILGSSVRLGRREESFPIDRDRTALRRFAGEVQLELQRLEKLYESHLDRLTHISRPGVSFEVRRSADRLVGVRQFSVLFYQEPNGRKEIHIPITLPAASQLPVPTFDPKNNGIAGKPVLLDPTRFFEVAERSGWIDEPGKPLMFWERNASDQMVVLQIDEAAVSAAVDGWLKSWSAARFMPVRVGGGPDQFRGSGEQPLLVEGPATTSRPDFLLPLRSRLGNWELASWDRRETRVSHSPAVLTAGVSLSLLVALLGVLIYVQQHRAATVAAQRVSFVNRVSHELRTPLTNILLNLDLATDALADSPDDATRRLGLVQEETRRLGRLIDNVLAFSRSEEGKLHAARSACVPASVIAAVVEQFAPSFARRALEVRCSGDVTAPCLLDADALAQILANLLSNVEKYVPGGVVEITGAFFDGTLSVIVADQGPGIPAEAAERIFRPFERLDSRINEGASGTGLGLAIARDLAIAMGGTLRLLPGTRGASFELRVPASLIQAPKLIPAA